MELPNSDSRTTVIGATGSGKTQFATWLLSTRDYFRRPWFILDFKGEKLFSRLGFVPFNLGDELPDEPNLYWIRILPGSDELVSAFFQQIYMKENCGIYIDEGFMLPYQDKWIRACLTQGRSKNIEMICLTQRPVKIDIWFLSEASYLAVFNLNVKDDKKRVSEYMDGLTIRRLPKFYCLWYDVAENEHVIFEPVPEASEIIETFQAFEEEKRLEEMNDQSRRIVEL